MCPLQRSIRPVVVCAALSAAAFAGTRAQDPTPELSPTVRAQLIGLASHVANLVHRPGVARSLPKLLVVDFSTEKSPHISRLGTLLADQFSSSLASIGDGFVILDRKPIPEFLRENWMQPDDLRDGDVCLWIARQLGGAGVIRGILAAGSGSTVRLSIRVEGLGTTLYSDQELTMSDEMQGLLAAPVPAINLQPDAIPAEPGVLAANEGGVTSPACIECPDPNYTSIARLLKYQGSLTLSVVVGVDGKPTAIKVVKGAPYGLTKEATDVVRRWRLAPAQKDGKPVPVRVNVEIVFRLSE